MPTKEERAKQAAKHLAFVNTVFASDTAASIEATVIYEDGDGRELAVPEPRFEATATDATTDFTVTALFKAQGKVAVVDPCAFTKPGGNYVEGAFGPEQALCADSNLYPILCGLKETYHDANRDYWSGQLFTDRALWIPDVKFTRSGDLRAAGIVAVPAPNRTRALENHRSAAECDQAIKTRIETIMRIAAANGVDTLICNAFGCGFNGNDDTVVAQLFRDWIDAHQGVFENVIFAVPRANFAAFDALFAAPEIEEPVYVPTDEEDEDDFDIYSIELPEGITLR
ncbi:TIGR02452 family protein [Slackia heliotrinireducens]|uniref:TIGR02452 family protein n=1 Tax=Slackia heliotrinireducens TaxID=84110 RepID=UPI003314EB91